MIVHARKAAVFFLVFCISFASAATVHVTGTVTDKATSAPIAGAQVSLTNVNVSVVTDNQGRFTIDGTTAAIGNVEHALPGLDPIVKGCFVRLYVLKTSQQVRIDVFDLAGHYVGTPVNRVLSAGVYQFAPIALLKNQPSHQLYVIKVKNGSRATAHAMLSSISAPNGLQQRDQSLKMSLEKLAAGVDVLKVTATGYQFCSQELPSYSSTGITIQLSSVSSAGTGLTGQYYSDPNFSIYKFSRLDTSVNFTWGYSVTADPAIPADNFSVRWYGQVLAPATGTYTFTVVHDDGARLWVNGQQIINIPGGGSATNTGTIALTAGQKYNIKMEYFQNAGAAVIKLSWTPPNGSSVIIPKMYLFPATLACTPNCDGKTCGPDGCGGTCGTCGSSSTCNSSGICIVPCIPNCSGKTCGSDGCGGSCGSCGSGQNCSSISQCASALYTLTYPQISGSTSSTKTVVGLNDWGPVTGMTETAYVTDPGHWTMYVNANNPAGSVLLFTNSGQPYNDPLLSSYTSIISSFDVTIPDASTGATGWNGYDIWLNNWSTEIMIQTVWINATPCPSSATATFGGSNGVPLNSWSLCECGSPPGFVEHVWKLNGGTGPDATALTVDIKAMLQWLIDHGNIANKASTLHDISFGFEVCNTNGVQSGPWSVNAFSVTTAK
jgi:hypothetical protein